MYKMHSEAETDATTSGPSLVHSSIHFYLNDTDFIISDYWEVAGYDRMSLWISPICCRSVGRSRAAEGPHSLLIDSTVADSWTLTVIRIRIGLMCTKCIKINTLFFSFFYQFIETN